MQPLDRETFFVVLPFGEKNESFFAVQYPGGLRSVRTCRPVRTISTMKNMLRKCCQPNHAGNPTGALSGWDACPS